MFKSQTCLCNLSAGEAMSGGSLGFAGPPSQLMSPKPVGHLSLKTEWWWGYHSAGQVLATQAEGPEFKSHLQEKLSKTAHKLNIEERLEDPVTFWPSILTESMTSRFSGEICFKTNVDEAREMAESVVRRTYCSWKGPSSVSSTHVGTHNHWKLHLQSIWCLLLASMGIVHT